jgi:hypothetical protein
MGEHNMTDAAIAANVPDSTFPRQIEVTFILRLTVDDQFDRDYWLETGTDKVTLDAIADVTDILLDNLNPALETVNGLTYEQIKQAMADREV